MPPKEADERKGDSLLATYRQQLQDSDAPSRVLKASVLTSLAGSTFGGFWAYFRFYNPIAGALRAGLNSFVWGFTFFSARDYFTTPLAAYVRSSRRKTDSLLDAAIAGSSSEPLTPWGIRLNMTAESASAGAITGLILSRSYTTRRGIRPALITTSSTLLLATLAQITTNQIRLSRINYLAAHPGRPEEEERIPVQTLRAAMADPSRKPEGVVTNSFAHRLVEILTKISPVTKITDEDYMARLERQRDLVGLRLGALEEEEKALYASGEGR